ncbi:MAG: hypothetical protein EP309_06810 [Gammaproteobacteria bacterium]|nr:hypothetical protein [Candidatus Thioaporhodococcus sediminis]TNF53710.1 MAG: hypothetical protein EP309_06810 [Gammaproteobacteria bacterium]
MPLSPALLALTLASLTQASLLLLASGFALRILRHWDLNSGSERQLELERRTYLVASLVAWVFGASLLSLLLFVYHAEQLSSQFVGAMCATGVLNANAWGWPALYLKMALFFAGAAWLLLNRVDNRAPDYPLVRPKYALLLLIAPLALAEALVQGQFFAGLNPDLITSCCGALFGPDSKGVAAELAGIDPAVSLTALYLSGLTVLASGLIYRWRGWGGHLFALAAAFGFGVALVAIVSGVALYVYEHPHHHCPFCLLKTGHDLVGYALYPPLFAATALALGVGLMTTWRRVPSLEGIIAAEGRRLAGMALILFAIFHGVATWLVLRSNLVLLGSG